MTIPYHTETWELDPSNNIFPVINGKILANKMFDCRLRRFFKSGLWVRFSNLFIWVLCDLKMNLYIISIGSHWKKTSTSMWGTPSEKDPKMKPWFGEKLDRKHLRVVLDDTLRPWTEAQRNMELNFRWVKEFILLIVISDMTCITCPFFCLRVLHYFSKMPPFYGNFTDNATLMPENSMRTIWHFRRLWIQSGSSSGPWYC